MKKIWQTSSTNILSMCLVRTCWDSTINLTLDSCVPGENNILLEIGAIKSAVGLHIFRGGHILSRERTDQNS